MGVLGRFIGFFGEIWGLGGFYRIVYWILVRLLEFNNRIFRC